LNFLGLGLGLVLHLLLTSNNMVWPGCVLYYVPSRLIDFLVGYEGRPLYSVTNYWRLFKIVAFKCRLGWVVLLKPRIIFYVD